MDGGFVSLFDNGIFGNMRQRIDMRTTVLGFFEYEERED
jgi:hypothetical protein